MASPLKDCCYILTLWVFLSYENYSVFYPDEEIVYINANPGTIVHIEIYVLKKFMNKALFIGLKMNSRT